MTVPPSGSASPTPFWKNWEFIVTTFIALISIVVTIWLWQIDKAPQLLQAAVVSTAPLDVNGMLGTSDVQIVVGGNVVPSPHLTTLELINNGSKPIPAADFHSPVAFSVGDRTQIVRASVVSTSPDGIEVQLSATKQSVSLAPLLLNPNDSIHITVITSGSPPVFSVNARVAGIKTIPMENGTDSKPNRVMGAFTIVLASVLFVTYLMFLIMAGANATLDLSRWVGFVLAIGSGLASARLFSDARDLFQLDTFDSIAWGTALLAMLVLIFYRFVLNDSVIVPR